MPMNKIAINGSDDLTYEVPDSFMPVIIKWIEYATKTPEEGTQRESVMGSMVEAMIQERYGPGMTFSNFLVRHYADKQQYVVEVELSESERMHPESS